MEFSKWVKGAVAGVGMLAGVGATELSAQTRVAKDVDGVERPTIMAPGPGKSYDVLIFQGTENLIVPDTDESLRTAKSLKDFDRLQRLVAQKYPGVAQGYLMSNVTSQELKKLGWSGSYADRINLVWFLHAVGVQLFPSKDGFAAYAGEGDKNLRLERNIRANTGLFRNGDLSREDAAKWKIVD